MSRLIFVSNSAWNIKHFREPIWRRLLDEGHDLAVAAPPDGHEKILVTHGISFIPLQLNPSGRNPLTDIVLTARLWKIFRQFRPDAVLTFTIKPNIFGSVAGRLAGARVLPTISGLGSAFLAGGLLARVTKWLFKLALSGSAAVFFQNRDDRDLFVRLRLVSSEKTRLVAGSGIDLTHFQTSPIPRQKPFTFLQIGRILADKGIYELVEATRILRQGGKAVRVVVLGEIESNNPSAIPRAEVQAWIREGIIDHLPPVSDVRPSIVQSHAVILASYREGLPRSLLEGAAMGRPLLASDVTGCRDVVYDGVNGVLFEARSAKAAADAMTRMLELSDEELDRMGAKSRALAEQKFDKRLVVKAYLSELSS